MLTDRTAIVFGAAGSVGRSVSHAFAEAGARVFLTGRTAADLAELAGSLSAPAGYPEYTAVDAYDVQAVAEYVDAVRQTAGNIDIVFNAVTYGDVQETPLLDMDFRTFARPIENTVAAQYGVTQAAARHMAAQGHGLILTITGHGPPHPGMGTTAVSWALVEAMLRQWAVELGPHGVRVSWLRTGGFLESVLGDRDYGSSFSGDTDSADVLAGLEADTMLGRMPSVEEAGRAAVYLATSPTSTANAINLTAGAVTD